MRDRPYVSVIIPVYNDPARLRLCLEALDRQSYPADRYEVLVVDNGSEPPVRDVLAEVLARRPHVRLLEEARPGSYAARNLGISEARGDILAFTDSDCIPEARWIEEGVRALRNLPDGGLVGGRIEVFAADPARPRAVELYEMAVAFDQRKNIEVRRFAVTANAFTTRGVVERIGGFDPALRSGGDHEWGTRVWRSGYPLVYAADAVVRHPARATFGEIAWKMVRVAHGHHALAERRPLLHRLAEWPRFLAPPFSVLALIARTKELEGAGARIRAGVVAVAVKYAWSWARIRLALGLTVEAR